MYGAGAAAQFAAKDVAEILKRNVADNLEASEADIVLEGGRVFVAGVPDSGVSVKEAVALASASGPVIGKGRFFESEVDYDRLCVDGMFFGSFIEPTFHCHGVEVLVDEATGNVHIGRYIAAHDIGRVVNPVGVRGQVEGGVVQGIGYALYEEVTTDSAGRTVNDSFVDYRMPTAADIPDELEILVIEDYHGDHGPHGAKGIGEAPALLPAAAIGSAVRDAVGAQPTTLPLSGPRVFASTAAAAAAALER
jgi:CO/xanthine dehydrogenase Mo-binding subunit